jgi:putative transposase
VRKVWRHLLRDGIKVARCTVARLMKVMGLERVRRGHRVKTTRRDDAVPCPLVRVRRQFRTELANTLWVVDFTYCWIWSGFVYVAFVTDVFARRMVSCRVPASMRTDFVLDALIKALHDRQPPPGLIHHSDHGSQLRFKGWLQHLMFMTQVVDLLVLLLVVSIRGFYAVVTGHS